MQRGNRLHAVAWLWLVACGGPDTQTEEMCGVNDPCPQGFTCDPVTNRCIRLIASADAAVSDAPPPDAAPAADAAPSCVPPDVLGADVYYASRARATGAAHGTSFRVAASGVTPLLDGARPVGVPGGGVLYQDGDADGSRGDLWLRDADGMTRRLFDSTDFLVAYDVTPTAPPRVVFDYFCGMKTVALDATGVMDLAISGSCYFDAPAVRASDGRLAFHSVAPGGPSGLFHAEASGAGRTQVATTVLGDVWPVWAPSGAYLAFLRTAGTPRGPIMAIAPDGSGSRTIAPAPMAGDGFLGRVAFSADGARVVAAGRVNGMDGLWTVPSDGSAAPARVCVPDGPELNWVSRVP
jgi:hypothetical protein